MVGTRLLLSLSFGIFIFNNVFAGNIRQFKSLSDIRYAEKRSELSDDNRNQDRLLNIYYPGNEPPKGGYPVVMFIHGGGFATGSRGGTNAITSGLLSNGYAIVSISYVHKLAGTGIHCTEPMRNGVPKEKKYISEIQEAIDEATYDAELAAKWIYEYGEKYHLSPKSIAVCGASAGACTAITLAYFVKPKKPRINAVINLWGAIANPDEISSSRPPMLTIHGSCDKLINVEYATTFNRRLTQVGNTGSKTIIVEGGDHTSYMYVYSGNELLHHILDFLKMSRR